MLEKVANLDVQAMDFLAGLHHNHTFRAEMEKEERMQISVLLSAACAMLVGLMGAGLGGCAHTTPEPEETRAGALPTTSGGTMGQNIPLEANPKWFVCEQHQDCRAEPGPCRAYDAVNALFVGPYRKYVEEMNRQLDCPTDASPRLAPPPVGCLKNRCVINPEEMETAPGAPSTDWPAKPPRPTPPN